jgi:hypothetical protein
MSSERAARGWAGFVVLTVNNDPGHNLSVPSRFTISLVVTLGISLSRLLRPW